jgi:hypothetical protein
LIMGMVLMGMTMVFTVSGRCLIKYKGIVSRAEDPKTFWQGITTYFILSLICFGLYLYTIYLASLG